MNAVEIEEAISLLAEQDFVEATGSLTEGVVKVLYLALHEIAKKWTMAIRDWNQAMSQFIILYGDRAIS